MTERTYDALTAWEAGDLPTDELVAAHPAAAGLIALHERMSAIAAEATPDPELGWAKVQERMTDRPSALRPKRTSKVLVSALVAAALTGSAAVAAPHAARSVLEGVAHGIGQVFGVNGDSDGAGGSDPNLPSASHPRGHDHPSVVSGSDDESDGGDSGGSGSQGPSGSDDEQGNSQGDEGDEQSGGQGDEEGSGGGQDAQDEGDSAGEGGSGGQDDQSSDNQGSGGQEDQGSGGGD